MPYYSLDDCDELVVTVKDQPGILADDIEAALEGALYQIRHLKEEAGEVMQDRHNTLAELRKAKEELDALRKTESTNHAHLRRLLEFINDPTKLRALLNRKSVDGLDSFGEPVKWPITINENLDQFIAAVRHMRDGEPDMSVEKRWGIKL